MRAHGAIPLLLSAAAVSATATPVGAQTAIVLGEVFDSIAATPLADAAVFLWDTPYQGVTDDAGRFRIEGVPPGEYSILFFHTRLGEMGVSPGPRPLVVRQGEPVTDVHLATPSMRTVITSQCLMEQRAERSGIVAGRVSDATSGLRLSGSSVSLSWNVPDAVAPQRISLYAGAGGWFYTCSAPADVPLLASATFFDRQGMRREVVVGADAYVEEEFELLSLEDSNVTGRLMDARTDAPIQGAEVRLRGTQVIGLSDGRGTFDLAEVAPGTYMLMVEHLAYGTKMDTLVVPSGQRLSVEMRVDTSPIAIAPINVIVEAPEPISARMAGGIVVTAEQIDRVRQRSRDASDVLRSLHVPGVLVRHRSNGTICVGYTTGQVKMNQTGCVEMMIYLNDVRVTDPDLALRLPPEAIERMVIYKPVEAGNLFGLGGGNGVWMIYTRGN